MARMAKVVDGQNEGDPAYKNMADSAETLAQSVAYQGLALVLEELNNLVVILNHYCMRSV